MAIIPKKLGIDDYDQFAALWEACGLPCKPRGRDSREEIHRQLQLSQLALWGIFDGATLVASVFATHDGRKGWINRLSVKDGYRRQGMAETLIQVAEKWFETQGIGIFTCLIEGENDASKAAFRASGYQLFEDVEYYTKRIHPDI